ncbi:MAG: nicotinamide mononucleotide transporter [Saprospiraceae bacterium]|nr:nicotinamide mononucleotide transporter [Saprospiraceae bacterium]
MEDIQPQLILEIIATLSGILCVYLQTKEKIMAWPFGILSVSISAFLFYQTKLYSDLLLHVVYIFLNIYGWYVWFMEGDDNTDAPIHQLKSKGIFLAIGLILVVTTGLGYFMGTFTDADLYYFDAFTTSGSLVAQYLLAKKYLQNWIIWIVVDLIAVPVYLYKGLYFIAFLFFVYLILCIKGWLDWRRNYRIQGDN